MDYMTEISQEIFVPVIFHKMALNADTNTDDNSNSVDARLWGHRTQWALNVLEKWKGWKKSFSFDCRANRRKGQDLKKTQHSCNWKVLASFLPAAFSHCQLVKGVQCCCRSGPQSRRSKDRLGISWIHVLCTPEHMFYIIHTYTYISSVSGWNGVVIAPVENDSRCSHSVCGCKKKKKKNSQWFNPVLLRFGIIFFLK